MHFIDLKVNYSSMYMFDLKKNLLCKSPCPTFFLFSNKSPNPSPKPFFQEHFAWFELKKQKSMITFYCQFKILLQPNHNKVWEIINGISEIRENKIVSLKSWESLFDPLTLALSILILFDLSIYFYK